MNIEQIVEWIIKNPKVYPGLHLEPNPRTSEAFKPLEPKSQMLIIWKSFCEYLKERMLEHKGINVKNFGAFTYEVESELPKTGFLSQKGTFQSIGEIIIEKKTTHRVRPTFLVDNRYKKFLTKFLNKDELIKPKSQSSIYQKGHQMTYCNPVPIAASSYLNKSVVTDCLNSIFNAIYDLLNLGKNVTLKLGFCNIYFDKTLTYSFAPCVTETLSNRTLIESKFKKGVTPVENVWKTSAISKWAKSSLSSVLERPQTPLVKTIDNKTQMLKIMSLDLASSHKPLSSNNSLTSIGNSSKLQELKSIVSLPKINNK